MVIVRIVIACKHDLIFIPDIPSRRHPIVNRMVKINMLSLFNTNMGVGILSVVNLTNNAPVVNLVNILSIFYTNKFIIMVLLTNSPGDQ